MNKRYSINSNSKNNVESLMPNMPNMSRNNMSRRAATTKLWENCSNCHVGADLDLGPNRSWF